MSKQTKTTKWYNKVGMTIWNSKLVKYLAQALTIVSVAYTALNLLTNLTSMQQLQGAIALVAVAVVVNRAFRK